MRSSERAEFFDPEHRRGPAATLAATLAEELGQEKLVFKRNVRKLKELGLTESLEIGYRLSARGRALLKRLG
jgi:hypothetical protein